MTEQPVQSDFEAKIVAAVTAFATGLQMDKPFKITVYHKEVVADKVTATKIVYEETR